MPRTRCQRSFHRYAPHWHRIRDCPLTFSATSLDFGNLEAGTTSASKNVTLTNASNSTSVTINAVSSSGSSYTETDTCAGQTLAPSGTCTLQVKFQPASNFIPVSYPGAITVSSSSFAQVIGLSGTAVAPVTSDPAEVIFPTVQVGLAPPTQTITLTNHDSASETVSVSDFGAFSITNNTCPASMPAGSQCTLGVDWNGGSGGPSTGALNVNASSGGFLSPQVVNLSACSTYAVVSPQSLNFGDVPAGTASETQTISIFNADPSSPLKISSAKIAGPNSSDFTITNNTCGSSVAVAGSCEIEVKLTPSVSGSRAAVFNLADDNFCSPQQTTLTGGPAAGPFTLSIIDVLTFFNGAYQSSGTILGRSPIRPRSW